MRILGSPFLLAFLVCPLSCCADESVEPSPAVVGPTPALTCIMVGNHVLRQDEPVAMTKLSAEFGITKDKLPAYYTAVTFYCGNHEPSHVAASTDEVAERSIEPPGCSNWKVTGLVTDQKHVWEMRDHYVK